MKQLLVAVVVAAVVGVFVPGCAEERWLTKEQDEGIGRMCVEDGCKVIPLPVWEQIKQRLSGTGV